MRDMPLVLIVDDEIIIRDILAKMIHALGYAVMQAANSSEAQQMIRQHTPDLILLDMIMPGVDSIEVLRSVRDDEALKHIAIILISGIDDLEAVGSFIEAGIDDFLPKPFNKALLTLKINACLSQMKSRESSDEAKQLMEGFCRDLSHDLNNALTGIIMTAELMLMNAKSEPDKEYIADIIESSEKITGLIKERRKALASSTHK